MWTLASPGIIGIEPFEEKTSSLIFVTKRNTFINVNLWDNIHVVLRLRLRVNWGQIGAGLVLKVNWKNKSKLNLHLVVFFIFNCLPNSLFNDSTFWIFIYLVLKGDDSTSCPCMRDVGLFFQLGKSKNKYFEIFQP